MMVPILAKGKATIAGDGRNGFTIVDRDHIRCSHHPDPGQDRGWLHALKNRILPGNYFQPGDREVQIAIVIDITITGAISAAAREEGISS
ncbi:hypothetical protein AJ88_37755 [Mesorhizobium amorphae CCBAU 01583]|nr:hypothetical protein AJ88_37755 [Mesorhizobium amorphae CCBAU 01583]